MASECLELVRIRGGQKGPSHGPSVGGPSCVTLMLGLIASNFERINSHCFKSLHLWSVCWVSHRKTSQVGTVDKDCNSVTAHGGHSGLELLVLKADKNNYYSHCAGRKTKALRG